MRNSIIVAVILFCIANVSAQEKTRGHDRNYVIKYSLFQPLLSGEFPFSFEHAINSTLSYEVTAGLTVSQLNNFASSPNLFNSSMSVSTYDDSKIGFVLQGALRIYPLSKSNAPRGFFISPELKFRQYRIDVQKIHEADGSFSIVERPFNQFILRFNVGYQFIIKNALAVDLFGGIGLNQRTGKFPVYNSAYDEETDTWSGQSGEYRMNKVIPHATIGVRIGFAGKFK